MRQLSFYFDSSACSGCKACQIACKDKHGLEVGRLWRRVYELSGGGWIQVDGAWQNTAFAYYLSIACNHCEKPICAEVCPVKAITKRSDGVVLIHESRCIGCKYCSWACPYGALQFNKTSGTMSKCTFCADELDIGKSPACVAACPMRILDYGEKAAIDDRNTQARGVVPLPDLDLTEPALHIQAHKDAALAPVNTRVANGEETGRAGEPGSERSLVAFTLLAQTASGAFLFLFLLYIWLTGKFDILTADLLTGKISLAIGVMMGAALLASSFHLGKPFAAWRAFANPGASWLSREILFATLFTALIGLFAGLQWLTLGDFRVRIFFSSVAVLCGLALIYSMAHVYMLRTAMAWNTPYTALSFFATTFLLGSLFTSTAYVWIWTPAGQELPLLEMRFQSTMRASIDWLVPTILFMLLANCAIIFVKLQQTTTRSSMENQLQKVRLTLLAISAVMVSLLLIPTGFRETKFIYLVIIGLSLFSELIGRVLFYTTRKPVL